MEAFLLPVKLTSHNDYLSRCFNKNKKASQIPLKGFYFDQVAGAGPEPTTFGL